MKLHLALAALALVLPAQEPKTQQQSPWEYMLAKYDADGDGKITRKEYTRDDEHWKNLDVDRSGVLEQQEFEDRKRLGGPRKRGKAPKVGAKAPNFKLEALPDKYAAKDDGEGDGDGKKPKDKKPKKPELVQLSSFKGKRPVALIFGSYT